jgi:hypothetical protein
MGAGAAVNYSDLPEGAKVLDAPTGNYSDLPAGAKVLQGGPSLVDRAEAYGRQFLSHLGTGVDSFYPVRVARGIYDKATGKPGAKEELGNIATDAIRDFAVAGVAGPESAPEKQPSLAVERGPRYMWGKTIPDESGGAPFPEKPPAEVLRARGLANAGQAALPEPSAGLGRIPVAEPEPTDLRPFNVRRPGEIAPEMPRPRAYFGGIPAEPIPSRSGLMLSGEVAPPETPSPKIATSQKAVGRALENSLGAEPLQSNVPLRNQVSRAEPVSQSKIESSVIADHDYDPQSREFHVTTKTNPNITYVYGDVDPEQIKPFESGSKGKAWAEFKKGGSPLVAKIVNGERIPVRPVIRAEDMNPEGGSRVLRNPAPEDLTDQLRESLRDALSRRTPKSQPAPPR